MPGYTMRSLIWTAAALVLVAVTSDEVHAIREIKPAPSDAGAYFRLGATLHRKGDLDGAIRAYRQALTLKPDDAETHCSLGLALNGRGDLDNAVRAYRRAIQINPDNAQAHYNLGLALKARGDSAGAVQVLRTCLRLSVAEQDRQRAQNLIRELGGAP